MRALVAIATLCCAATAAARAPKDKPNIVMFFVDDLGYGDMGFTGNTMTSTPNIDQLAYGGKVLLQNSKLHLKKGHRYGLIGANGVGKTTLMRAIANNQLDEFPNDILRTIFVEHDLDDGENDEISVTDWIKKTKIIRDENTDEDIDAALDRMGFNERKSQSIGSLSGGWKMKLALSRAM